MDPRRTIFLASIDTSNIIRTKEQVFAMLDDFVEKIGEENVVHVVTDNATNYKAAGEMLMKKRKKVFCKPCAAYCIDLMLEDFEKKIEELFLIFLITTFIYNKSRLISVLKEFTKGKELLRPGASRFATSYLTLGGLFELKGALISMFESEKWLSTNYARIDAGKNVEDIIMDNQGFWPSVVTCLKAASPLMKVLRLVDLDSEPAMGFIYQAMVNAKNKIKSNFKNVQTRYEPIQEIINERWYYQLNRALHVGKLTRKEKTPVDWWDSYRADTPELWNFAKRISSLTCSSLGTFQAKKSTTSTKDEDLVYVMYNLKLNGKEEKKGKEHDQMGLEALNLDDVSSDDDWITKEESSNQYADEEWINRLDGSSSSRPQASDGGEDVEVLERAIRDQLREGGRRELGEDVLDLGNSDMDAPFFTLD
uniref:DUF659 domain-containing protein n=1 Tax=Lactuca sativa TaxID=4236 RepID=A0A9R1WM09_LACSA|nr:hypothetical protein LSAT_V11C100038430 [Lactuca sativa]